jgi:hypothetical protein
MVRWLGILGRTLRSFVRTHRELALENLALRQQLAVWKAATAAERHGPNVLGSALEAVDELAAFTAAGTAGDGGRLAQARIPTVLGVEESVSTWSAQH